MQEALRTYLELAMGLTEASRKRVQKVVEDVVVRGGATAEQVKVLTGDLLALNSANRKSLTKLVKFEVDRALGMVGLATADEVNHLTQRVRDLERQLRVAETRAEYPPSPNAATKAATKAASKAPSKAPTKARAPGKAASATASAGPAAPRTATKAAAKTAKKAVAKKASASRAQP
jgi:polyhydroxyalkanoate synthesis regulator phasin